MNTTYNHYLAPDDNGWTKDKYKAAFETLRKDTLLLCALIRIRNEKVNWGHNTGYRNNDVQGILMDFFDSKPDMGFESMKCDAMDKIWFDFDKKQDKKFLENLYHLSAKIMFGLGGYVFDEPHGSVNDRSLPRAFRVQVRKHGVYRRAPKS